ncbi:MAG TPA: acylphosphatase [Candidatus Eisenbacteria bacterium]|nr:acylphosphatase [Candidatus Eisenbacteria bacterium]
MQVTHLLIFGHVHGVGFRKFVRHTAQKLGLVGWVRNLPEGIHSASSGQAVEAEVMGEEKKVQELIKLCKKGPYLAEVSDVEVQSVEKDFPYNEFMLRHDTD